MTVSLLPRGGPPRVLHVCGFQGAGKTSWILRRVDLLRSRGLGVGGIVQPALPGEGWQEGYDLLDLSSDERIRFARRLPDGSGFAFEPAAWTWAAERIRTARREADVLVVDECGRLEAQGGGHLPALLTPLAGERCSRWILAVRREVLAGLRARLGLPLATVRLPGGTPRSGPLRARPTEQAP
ncbi:MAG: DUF2478 domain-containing protein [Deltaproteobacteria bacterium]|nr:DUF2478 domain-containing protein [Deltaproteobacteria bacterium]